MGIGAEPPLAVSGHEPISWLPDEARQHVQNQQKLPSWRQMVDNAERSVRCMEQAPIRFAEYNGVGVVGECRSIQHVPGRLRAQGGKHEVIVPLMSEDPQNGPVAQRALSVKEEDGLTVGVVLRHARTKMVRRM